jgi:hypothetical protein
MLLSAGCAGGSSGGAGPVAASPSSALVTPSPTNSFGQDLAGVPACSAFLGKPVVGVAKCHITTLVVDVTITHCTDGSRLYYYGSPYVDDSFYAVGRGPLRQLPVTVTPAYSKAYDRCTRKR